MTKMKVLQWFI